MRPHRSAPWGRCRRHEAGSLTTVGATRDDEDMTLSRHVADRPAVAGQTDAQAAWIRAAAYVTALIALATVSGTVAAIGADPWGLTGTPGWWPAVTFYLAVVIIGYVVIWPRGTWTFGRPLVLPDTLLFGAAWGLAEGLLFATVWRGVDAAIVSAALAVAVAFVVLSAYVGLVHALWWDRVVAPPHNNPAWNLRKVLGAHVPNLLVGLIVVAKYDALGVLVLAQVIALISSSLAMRMPSPRT